MCVFSVLSPRAILLLDFVDQRLFLPRHCGSSLSCHALKKTNKKQKKNSHSKKIFDLRVRVSRYPAPSGVAFKFAGEAKVIEREVARFAKGSR